MSNQLLDWDPYTEQGADDFLTIFNEGDTPVCHAEDGVMVRAPIVAKDYARREIWLEYEGDTYIVNLVSGKIRRKVDPSEIHVVQDARLSDWLRKVQA